MAAGNLALSLLTARSGRLCQHGEMHVRKQTSKIAGACVLAMVLLSAMSAKSVGAREARWQIDPVASEASFAVRVLLVRKVQGEFHPLQGFVHRDLGTGMADVEVRIDTRGLKMENPGHADWARSDEFFDTEVHPFIYFQSAPFKLELLRLGGRLSGMLTLRGIVGAVQLELLPSDCARPGFDCPVRVQGDVVRSAFGMGARRYAVSDKVKLSLAIRVQDMPDSDTGSAQ